MTPSPTLLLRLVVILACLGLGAACDRPDDGTAPSATEELPPLTFGDDTPNLMLTWLDDKGDAHVEVRPRDVPIKGRDLVRVVVADSEHGQSDPFYVADLGAVATDGKWVARTMSRSSWEAAIAKRREAYLASVRPPPSQTSAPDAEGDEPPPAKQRDKVVIYGAEWCRPCHDAADYLRAQGVPVVVKDIEKSASAQSEMREKLERVGRTGSAIPIIDVGGEILIGFDRGSLDRALRRMRNGTVL